MRSTITFTAHVELEKGGSITVESLTAQGRSAAWIADVLGIDRRTVVRHRTQARKTA